MYSHGHCSINNPNCNENDPNCELYASLTEDEMIDKAYDDHEEMERLPCRSDQ